MRIAKEINEYRKKHPKMVMSEVMKSFPGINESNYYAWDERRRTVEAIRAMNKGEAPPEEQHFPLAAIPDRAAQPAKRQYVKKEVDDSKELAALLLEVASRLLKR